MIKRTLEHEKFLFFYAVSCSAMEWEEPAVGSDRYHVAPTAA